MKNKSSRRGYSGEKKNGRRGGVGIEQVGIGNQMTNEKVQNQVGERSLCFFFIGGNARAKENTYTLVSV